MLRYNKNLKTLSRNLRKNMTDAEILLWSKIRRKQLRCYQFYRQRIIGNYIVDFYCPKAKLVIEVDGGQHYFDKQKAIDKNREIHLSENGLNIMRFNNLEILKNIDGVLDYIDEYLKSQSRPK